MQGTLIARASLIIDALAADVWEALVDPQAIRQYMFGTTVVTDWLEGSPIVWKGEWQGKPYEDYGVIFRLKAPETLGYSHFSPLSGPPDEPANYHMVTIELSPQGDRTRVSLSQDNNATEEERAHSEELWGMMLAALKTYAEKGR